MWIGDEELNFTDEEARAVGPVRVARAARPTTVAPRVRRNRAQDVGEGLLLAGFVVPSLIMTLIVVIVSSYSRSGSSPHTSQSSEIHQQSPASSQQTAQPEYFPAGWAYVKATTADDSLMYRGNQIIRIPLGRTFFVSLRSINGFHLAVAEDDSWNGWVKCTGAERQIPMHPDFEGAKTFVEKLDWSLYESSYNTDAPSQGDAATDLGALGASEAQTERSTMLFQKKDSPQDGQEQPDITVQGEEATIPQPLAEDRKVKLPKTKWYLETEGASAPSFSWVCKGWTCGLWNGTEYVQTCTLTTAGIVAAALSTNRVPRAWACEVNDSKLYCTIQDGKGHITQGCIYDGKTLDCGN